MPKEDATKPVVALYASPECSKKPNLRLYKGYFNVAWFVRAYRELLFEEYRIITTEETKKAVLNVKNKVDKDLADLWGVGDDFVEKWRVPYDSADAYREGELAKSLESLGSGFDAQVALAAMVAKGEIDRLLMFQDPDDVQPHLPEAHALIRNCTFAGVALNINAGATFWAEAEWQKKEEFKNRKMKGYGKWRKKAREQLHPRINPARQTIAFIAHDSEKKKMSHLVFHIRDLLKRGEFELTGTSGTCKAANRYLAQHLADREPPWTLPKLRPAGAADSAGHGPTGGDVVIADQILSNWRCADNKKSTLQELCRKKKKPKRQYENDLEKKMHKTKPLVRKQGLSHTVIFFMDHEHAQPHQADIHVLLRTCLHPSHGVHTLLNERSAQEWAQTLSEETLST